MISHSSSDRPIAVDLFAGAGGMSLGLEMAGFEVAVANEINHHAVLTYSANHPGTQMIEKDIRRVTAKEILKAAGGKPLLVAGGPPCQGFSMAGRRNADDPRNSLVMEFLKKVKEIRP
ncbi:MAG: DNA cytosine methyltransferase, partial [Candidatus Aenigmatarchaeota archaeon]